jgi:hypothetical protein
MHSENIYTRTANYIRMQTTVPDRLAPGLTYKQLECLWFLNDGNWHDHKNIGMHIKEFISSNITGRINSPLENRGIVEQEERPEKEGSRKKKNFVRIRQDVDAWNLHLLIEYSANDLILKYNRKKQPEKADFFLKMRNESIKKLDELDKQEEESQQNEESEYWAQRLQRMDSDSWRKLVAQEKIVYEALKPGCKDCCKTGYCRTADCYPMKKPGAAFRIACMLNPALVSEIRQQHRDNVIASGQFYDSERRPDPLHTFTVSAKELLLVLQEHQTPNCGMQAK